MTKGFYDNSVIRWFDDRLPIFSILRHSLDEYPTPRNLNYWWNFGSLAGVTLLIMIVSGIMLAMNYTANVDKAFGSIERIMRDVNYGWLVRYIHMNGASMFFMVVYIHIFRGLYYGSYKKPREVLWGLGVIILLLMMATAFMGYTLPWGQMSFWGAQVITGIFTAIPVLGEDVQQWVLGSFVVDNPSLNRFYALHYLLPFLILGVVVLHIWALHRFGSNNPLGIDTKGPQDTVSFHPYYTVKDFYGLGVFFLIYASFVFYAPDYLGHPDNYIPADPLTTPPHIVPEWYFLPFYAMLRAMEYDLLFPFTDIVLIDAKLIGVLCLGGAVVILFFLPWLDSSPIRSARFRPIYRRFFWIFAVNCLFLGYLGAKSPDDTLMLGLDSGIPAKQWAFVSTIWYFAHFLVLMPLLARIERPLDLPESIATAVLTKNSDHQSQIPAEEAMSVSPPLVERLS